MPYVAPQDNTTVNADLTALNTMITTLQALRTSPPAGVNSRDTQLVQMQITALKAVTFIVRRRIARIAKLT
jgi:hypothetical protein